MDMAASKRAMDFLNKPAVISKIDQLLSEGDLKPEQRVLVRRCLKYSMYKINIITNIPNNIIMCILFVNCSPLHTGISSAILFIPMARDRVL